MTTEFKKIKQGNITRYVLETATAGATSAGAIATSERSVGEVQARVPQKPRQGPLKPQTGGGSHRDRKKEQKKGKEKHRKPFAEQSIIENPGLLGRAVAGAAKAASNIRPSPAPGAAGAVAGGIASAIGSGSNSDKPLGQTSDIVAPEGLEPDHEISMASNELKSIINDAKKLLMIIQRISEVEGLEAWQQSKITKATDYVSSVLRTLQGEQGVAETQGSRPIDKFRSKPSWDDDSEPADKNSPYYVAWSGQAWDDEDPSRPKGDAGRILVINIKDNFEARELAKKYDSLFNSNKFPDSLAYSKYVDYNGTYVGSMSKLDDWELEELSRDLRNGQVKDHIKEEGVAEGSSKQARAKKEAESVKAAIARLEQELKDPNPHIDKDDIRRRLETEKRRLELYRDVLDEQGVAEGKKKGLYYYVNRRKKAGTSRPKGHPKAPSAQDWKNAAKTAKKESKDVYLNSLFEKLERKLK